MEQFDLVVRSPQRGLMKIGLSKAQSEKAVRDLVREAINTAKS